MGNNAFKKLLSEESGNSAEKGEFKGSPAGRFN
jgi:hypothetical protein